MARGEKALSEATTLLENIKNEREDSKVIKFNFPVILDEMTQRAMSLVETYERLFLDRPKNIPLTPEENEKLMELRKLEDIFFDPVEIKGPVAIARGKFSEQDINTTCRW